jgi:hypothetical protein
MACIKDKSAAAALREHINTEHRRLHEDYNVHAGYQHLKEIFTICIRSVHMLPEDIVRTMNIHTTNCFSLLSAHPHEQQTIM